MMTKDFMTGFFGRRGFGMDAHKQFCEEWSKMTDEEKLEFMNKHVNAMAEGEHGGFGFSGKKEFSVENIDARCEEWLKKSPEEKTEVLKRHEEAFGERFSCMGGFFGRGRFGFFGGGPSMNDR